MVGPEERSALEAAIGEAAATEDYARAAERLLEGYGPEIAGFLGAMLRTPDEASDAFQVFCEEMWKSLPHFRQESSYRTWAYAIARHMAFRQIRSPHRKPARNIPLSSAPEVVAIADRVRTSTVQYLRTEVKDRVAELREQLDPEDRALFVLRLNRKMAWTDIARIIDGEDLSEAIAKKRATALRKRFQRAKVQVRALVAGDERLQSD